MGRERVSVCTRKSKRTGRKGTDGQDNSRRIDDAKDSSIFCMLLSKLAGRLEIS